MGDHAGILGAVVFRFLAVTRSWTDATVVEVHTNRSTTRQKPSIMAVAKLRSCKNDFKKASGLEGLCGSLVLAWHVLVRNRETGRAGPIIAMLLVLYLTRVQLEFSAATC